MLCPSSLQHRDSNPQPLDHESPPITTRPAPAYVRNNVTLCIRIAVMKVCQMIFKIVSCNSL